MTVITWTVDGWVGGATDPDGTDWFVSESEGWFGPPGVRTSAQDKPADDGEYSSRSYKTARVITLIGNCLAVTEELASQARDQFNALLDGGGLHQLTVVEPIEVRTSTVRLAGMNLTPIRAKSFEFQLIMTAPDPRKYSSVVHGVSTGLATSAPGGVLWNGSAGATGVQWNGSAGSTGVVWQSGSGSGGTMTLTNAWRGRSPILWSITGPVTNPRLVNLTTQETIRWEGTVNDGQTLVIDAGTGSVKLDGQNRKAQMSRTEYFSIGPQQTISVQFQADTSTASMATAQWRDAAM